MTITGTQLLQLIPQAAPMVMIDTLSRCDEKTTHTQLKVREDNIFYFEGRLQEAALIENMAQTAAARAGFFAKQKNVPVRKGFIGAIKNAEIFFLPKANNLLETSLELTAEIGDVSVVQCQISVNGKICAKAEFKIFLMD
jgi:predicted hotdog family 3-hydroxylacyl-ACP dehydratase